MCNLMMTLAPLLLLLFVFSSSLTINHCFTHILHSNQKTKFTFQKPLTHRTHQIKHARVPLLFYLPNN